MKRFLCLVFWLWAPALQAQVSGRVMDAVTREPVPHATVLLQNDEAVRSTGTAVDGRYSFSGAFAGEYRLRVQHPGYEATDLGIVVTAGRTLLVDLAVRARPVEMDPLRIATNGAGPPGSFSAEDPDSIARGAAAAEMPWLANMLGGAFADLGLGTPAARSPSALDKDGHPEHVLHVWGSGAGHGRVVLDGASLSAPLHLGRLLPPVEPFLLHRAEVFNGGAPAAHDGGAMYIVDFETRPARSDRVHASAEMDLLSGRASLEVPLSEDGSVLLGARRVNDQLVDLLAPGDFDYAYRDGLARADWRSGSARLRATAWASREAVLLPRDRGRDEAAWANYAFSTAARLGDSENTHVSASFTRGQAHLPLLSAPGGRVDAGADRILAGVTHETTHREVDLTAGLQVEHVRFFRRSSAYTDPSGATPERSMCTAALPCSAAAGFSSAIHASALVPLGGATTLRAGARAVTLSHGDLNILPRLKLTRLVGSSLSLSGSAGRFSQPAIPGRVAGAPAAEDDPIELVQADQLQLEAIWQLALRSRIAISAFSRSASTGGANYQPVEWTGIELAAVHRAGPTDLAFIYSVSRQQSRPHDAGSWLHRSGLSAETRMRRLRGTASVQYGNGIPVTSIVLEQPASEWRRLPEHEESERPAGQIHPVSYVRIDASVGAEWVKRVGSRTWVVVPYAKLVNAARAEDALFFFEEPDSDGTPQPLAALPTLPVIGVALRF